jgi:hypothetical protein
MQRSYKFLSILLGIGWSALFLLQATTHVLNDGLNTSKASPVHQTKSLVPGATPITVITGGQGGINRIPDAECTSGIMSTPADVLKLLAPGWTINDLGAQYRNETKQILCYDGWDNAWSKPGGTWLNTVDFLATMHWPSDLFNPSVKQILIVQRPDEALKPSNNTGSQQKQGPSPADECMWGVNLGVASPNINICDLISAVLKGGVLTPLKFGVNNLAGNTNSFLWTTPPQLSYANPDLALFWNTSLYIVNALLVVVIAWAALRYTMGQSFGSWLSYADLIEMVPRIVLALLAAYVSARICQVVIDGSNALGSIFNTDLLSNLQNEPADLFSTFVQIFLCLLSLLLILEEAVRFAILFVLIGFSPVWAFCGGLRETQFIFKGALKALFFMSLLQPCQLAVMSLGQHMTTSIGGKSDSLLYSFVNIALLLLVLFMMSAFLRASGFSMPFGWTGVAMMALGGRAMGQGIGATVRASGRAITASGRGAITAGKWGISAYRRTTTISRSSATSSGGSTSTSSGGSSATSSSGSTSTAGGRSTSTTGGRSTSTAGGRSTSTARSRVPSPPPKRQTGPSQPPRQTKPLRPRDT